MLRARYVLPPAGIEVPQIGTLRGRGCWHRHAARARAAGIGTLCGQGLLAWRAARVSVHVLVRGRAAHDDCEGDSACRLLRSLRSLRARCVLPPAGTEVPQIAKLRGRGCWHRHAARVSLHVLVSVSAAHDDCEGDSACRLLRSLRSLRARFRLTPAVTEVPQIGTLRGRGCRHRHAEGLSWRRFLDASPDAEQHCSISRPHPRAAGRPPGPAVPDGTRRSTGDPARERLAR